MKMKVIQIVNVLVKRQQTAQHDNITDSIDKTTDKARKSCTLDFVLAKNFDIVNFSWCNKEHSIASDTNASRPTHTVNVVNGFAWRVILNNPVNVRQIQATSSHVLRHNSSQQSDKEDSHRQRLWKLIPFVAL